MNPEQSEPGLGYAWYVVVALTAVYMFSFIDRTILGMLVAPIQAELGISDTQFGRLAGISFSIFYVSMGIPLGRIADTYFLTARPYRRHYAAMQLD